MLPVIPFTPSITQSLPLTPPLLLIRPINTARPTRNIPIHAVHVARIVVVDEAAGGGAVVEELEFPVGGCDALLAGEAVAEGISGWAGVRKTGLGMGFGGRV